MYQKKLVKLIFVILFLFMSKFTVYADDISIISENESGMTIEVNVPNFEMKNIQIQDQVYQQIQIKDWAMTSQIGAPQLPFKSIFLQVPESGDIAVNILESESESLTKYSIYPTEDLRLSDDGNTAFEFVKDENIYNNSSFFPKSIAEIDSQGILRNTSLARLKIYPFQWNPVTQELRCYKKIRLEIKFEKALSSKAVRSLSTSASDILSIYDEIKNKTIINYKSEYDNSAICQRSNIIQSISRNKGVKISTEHEGIYRIYFEDIANLGIETAELELAELQVFHADQEIAVNVISENNVFEAGSYIEFFAEKTDSKYSDKNIYRLFWGDSQGKRMSKIDGSLSGSGKKQNSFYKIFHLEEELILWERTPGAPESEYWFWEKLSVSANPDTPKIYEY
ncbi:hypothetical protein GMMP13_1810019 [Candidatus Magnetomoraceae bacterium gMMP-13]